MAWAEREAESRELAETPSGRPQQLRVSPAQPLQPLHALVLHAGVNPLPHNILHRHRPVPRGLLSLYAYVREWEESVSLRTRYPQSAIGSTRRPPLATPGALARLPPPRAAPPRQRSATPRAAAQARALQLPCRAKRSWLLVTEKRGHVSSGYTYRICASCSITPKRLSGMYWNSLPCQRLQFRQHCSPSVGVEFALDFWGPPHRKNQMPRPESAKHRCIPILIHA